MAGNNLVYNRVKLCAFGFINHVIFVHTGNRLVGGNFNNVELINLLKFGFFGHGGTRHTRKLGVKAEEVLEGYGCQGFRFVSNGNPFLSFDCLVQAFVIAAAKHKATCKFVNNNNLAVFYNVVNVALHYTVCANGLVNVVGNGNVFAVVKVFNLEKFFSLLNARCGKGTASCLFVYNVVAVVVGVLVAGLVVHFFDNKLFE